MTAFLPILTDKKNTSAFCWRKKFKLKFELNNADCLENDAKLFTKCELVHHTNERKKSRKTHVFKHNS